MITLDFIQKLVQAAFSAQAVNFDGTNDYLTRGADLTGVSDGQSGTLSVWLKHSVSAVQETYAITSTTPPCNFYCLKSSGDVPQIVAQDASNNLDLILNSVRTIVPSDGWTHFLASWNNATGVAHLYINDVECLASGATITNDTLDYAGDGNFAIGGETDAGAKFNGDMAEFWLLFNTYIDFTVEANRRKFISSKGLPVDLGATGSLPTGGTPHVYLSGATASWHTNKGSGGGFTENGALTDAATSPLGPFEAEIDPTVLIHFIGPDTSTTFRDVIGHTVAGSGTAQIDTAQSKFFGSSVLLDGNLDYLTVTEVNGDLALGTGDFTISCWLRRSSTGTYDYVFDFRPASTNGVYPTLYIANDDQLEYYVDSATRIQGTTTLSADTWYHIELSRVSGTTRLFLNGTQEGSSYTDSNNYLIGSNRFLIGQDNNLTSSVSFGGWFDEFVVIKGTGLHTTTFTPPALPYGLSAVGGNDANTEILIHCDGPDASTTFWDESTNARSITANGNAQKDTAQKRFGTSSALFDGTGDSLTVPASADFVATSTDYTIDFWFRANALAAGSTVSQLCGWLTNAAPSHTFVYIYNDGDVAVGHNSVNEIRVNSNLSTGVWYHLAIVRQNSGSTTTIYINGVAQTPSIGSSTTAVWTDVTSQPLNLGGGNYTTDDRTFDGWIDEFRISTTARWTSNFTPPKRKYTNGA